MRSFILQKFYRVVLKRMSRFKSCLGPTASIGIKVPGRKIQWMFAENDEIQK